MSEKRTWQKDQGSVIDREAIMVAIAPQIDHMVKLGFHAARVNRSHSDTRNEGDLEAEFRARVAAVLCPDRVENVSNLVVVMPNIFPPTQAELLGIQDPNYWAPWYSDSHFPTDPYLIEVTRGDPDQNPRKFARQQVGFIDWFSGVSPRGSLIMMKQGFDVKDERRGLTDYELLAYLREHGDSVGENGKVHALAREKLKIDKIIPELRGYYFPAVQRKDGVLYCTASPVSYVPKMNEVLYTRKNVSFLH